MSTRYGPGSSTEIWSHLNELDQDRIDLDSGLVKTVAQTLDATEKAQARDNLEAGFRPRFWSARPSAAVALTIDQYKSVKPASQVHALNSLGLTWSGDTFTPDQAGWYDLVWAPVFAVSSSGNRDALIVLNPGATTYASSAEPGGTHLNRTNGRAPTGGERPALVCTWSGYLAVTDVIMLIVQADDTTSLDIARTLFSAKLWQI